MSHLPLGMDKPHALLMRIKNEMLFYLVRFEHFSKL